MKLKRGDAMAGVTYGWITLAVLAIVVGFLGGSSRPDAVQLIALRPLAGIVLVAGLALMVRERWTPVRVPLTCLLALAALMIVQLIPLPPFVWEALPARAPIAEMGASLGLGDVWRPISLQSGRTLNALASLIVPLAALVVAMAANIRSSSLLLAIAVIGVVDAVFGILQVSGLEQLYFYAITNLGSPVGLFANQNHSAAFSALVLVVLALLGTDREAQVRGAGKRTVLAASYVLVLFAALLSGSRAGMLLTILAVAAGAVMFWQNLVSGQSRRSSRQSARPAWLGKLPQPSPRMLTGVALLLLIVVIAAFASADRAPAIGGLEALASGDSFEGMRRDLLPVLGEMMATFWLFGAGFGSFEEVYHMFEPASVMSPYYINQAHNDWAQFVIEGGLIAVLILGYGLVWMVTSLLRMARRNEFSLGRTIFWVTVLAILSLSSLVDYPLRAPLFQMVAMWLVAAFALQRFRYLPNG